MSGPPNPHGIGAYATKVSDNSLYTHDFQVHIARTFLRGDSSGKMRDLSAWVCSDTERSLLYTDDLLRDILTMSPTGYAPGKESNTGLPLKALIFETVWICRRQFQGHESTWKWSQLLNVLRKLLNWNGILWEVSARLEVLQWWSCRFACIYSTFMAALYVIEQAVTFLPCGFFLSFFLLLLYGRPA